MRVFFDTEFIEDGRTIDLISIGAVREDGHQFYAENADCDLSRASPWVRENVLPYLRGGIERKTRQSLRIDFQNFVGEIPEFWAYYAAYDWIVLCQLYGTMMDLPEGWPYYCLDVKQLAVSLGDPKLPEQTNGEHHALNDALWTMKAWHYLQSLSEGRME
jgi:hypothetical protein